MKTSLRIKNIFFVSSGTLALGLLLLLPGRLWAFSFPHRVKSLRPSNPMAIDADDYDWRRVELDEYQDLLIGAVNDDSNLYLYLGSGHREIILQMLGALRQTFTVRFVSKEKGANPPLAIRFSFTDGHPFMKADLPSGYDPVNLSVIISTVAVLQEGREPSSPEREDIQTAVGAARSRIFYELKVPIQKILPGDRRQALIVELETSKPDPGLLQGLELERNQVMQKILQDRRQRDRAEDGGGRDSHRNLMGDGQSYGGEDGEGGQGGGRRGGRGGRRGGGHKHESEPDIPVIPQPFKIDFTLKLTTQDR